LKNGAPSGLEREDVRHFDPWLVPEGHALIELASDLFSSLKPPPITPGRRHRADAMARRKACAETLIANLAMATLEAADSRDLVVPLRKLKRSRYDRHPITPDGVRWAADELAACGHVEIIEAVYKEQRTKLIPSLQFVSLLDKHGIKTGDVGRAAGGETIILQAGPEHERLLIDYRDSAEAVRLHAEMSAINEALAKANIRLNGEASGPIHLTRRFDASSATDAPSFDRHGRIYGGFWENLPRAERHLLTIGGEPVADLDFSSMFVRLAYIRQGAEPPEGDLYAIPGLEGHRDGVKRVLSSLFFRETKARRLPHDATSLLPVGWTMSRFRNAIVEIHPAIAPLLDTDIGFELMAAESNLLVAVLLRLISEGVVALPMHDGLMVAQSKKALASKAMEEVSLAKLGVSLPVTEKLILEPPKSITKRGQSAELLLDVTK